MTHSVRYLTTIIVFLLGAFLFTTTASAIDDIDTSTIPDSTKAEGDIGLAMLPPRVLLHEKNDICLKGPIYGCHGQLRDTLVSIQPRERGFELIINIKYVRLLDLPNRNEDKRPIIYINLSSGATVVKRVHMIKLWNDCATHLGLDVFRKRYIIDPNHKLMDSITSVSVGNTPGGPWGRCLSITEKD